MDSTHSKRQRTRSVDSSSSETTPSDAILDLLCQLASGRRLAGRWASRCARFAQHLQAVEEKAKILAAGGSYLKLRSNAVSATMEHALTEGPLADVLNHLRTFDEAAFTEWEADQVVAHNELMVSDLNVFTALPIILVSYVFSFLDQKDLGAISLVCKRFHTICRAHPRCTVTLRDVQRQLAPESAVHIARHRPRWLQILGKGNTYLELNAAKQLPLFSNLRHLYIQSPLKDEHFPYIAMLSTLRRLQLDHTSNVTSKGMMQLTVLTGLGKLILLNCSVRDTDVRRLCVALPRLTTLELVCSRPELTDAALVHLPTALKQLWITIAHFSDVGMSRIAGLRRLNGLSLVRCHVKDSGVACLSGLTALKILQIGGHQNVSDVGISSLAGLTRLQTLSLHHSKKVTDAVMPSLIKLTQLRTLSLDNTSVTDAALPLLTHLTTLELLSLDSCTITDEGLETLPRLPWLRELRVSHTAVSTEGLLGALSSLPSLKTLRVVGCPNVTVSLFQALPSYGIGVFV